MFERDHVVREIWTDGRSLPGDPDPLWYGYSTGKWVDDTTFVVESTGYDDRTWLGATGFPHSDTMRMETNAPAGSEIVPVMVPRSLWANATKASAKEHSVIVRARMNQPPFEKRPDCI